MGHRFNLNVIDFNDVDSVREGHKLLNAEIRRITSNRCADQSRVPELKKQKLRLKDRLTELEASTSPNAAIQIASLHAPMRF